MYYIVQETQDAPECNLYTNDKNVNSKPKGKKT